jgi:plasmid stability protein
MATVTIRNLDDEVVERVRQRAKANNRSLEAELRTIISREAGRLTPDELFRIADAIRESTRARPQTDSGILQRELREALERKVDRH